jgi:hypothetical protein
MYREGYNIWRNVTQNPVLLTEHYRARDRSVFEVLGRIARGRVTPLDIDLLQSRTFGSPNGPDREDNKWQHVTLVTRNNVRQAWNNQAALGHLIGTGNKIFISPSLDNETTCSRESLVWTIDSKLEYLPTWNVLALNAPATATTNVAVELGIANGTEVIIKEVVPHPEDDHGWSELHKQIVKLSRPPICVFVELKNGGHKIGEYRKGKPGWFPILEKKLNLKTPKELGTTKSFSRIRIPLTLGFCIFRLSSKMKDKLHLMSRLKGKRFGINSSLI